MAAAFVGVGFVVLLRVVLKARNPSDVTRQLAAATLTGAEPGFEQAFAMWLRDKPVRWLDETLQTAVRYRTLRGVLDDADTAVADLRAAEVAKIVAAQGPDEPRPRAGDPAASATLTLALQALDRIEAVAFRRT